MNNQLSPELLEKAKMVKSASELIALAKENGITLTEEAANTFYEKLNPKFGAVADEELDNVSGGCSQTAQTTYNGKPVNGDDPACIHWTYDFYGDKNICRTCRYYVPYGNVSICFD